MTLKHLPSKCLERFTIIWVEGYLDNLSMVFSFICPPISNSCRNVIPKHLCFRHAKRTTVNTDDVKLLARRNPKLVRCIIIHIIWHYFTILLNLISTLNYDITVYT